MGVRGFGVARLLRSILTPMAIALPPLFWVVSATERASRTPLGRDQGIFQYIAWALSQGQVDYRDVRDVNGPLTHLVHLAFLGLGGADEHRFRLLELAVTGATFAAAGACLPGLGGRRRAYPRADPSRDPSPDALERAGWAVAGWVVLSGQYLIYKYWDLAQRESFLDWFLLLAVALQLVAQAPRTTPARQTRLLAVVGALSLVPWFGKPTFAIFTAAQGVTLVADPGLAVSRRRALGAFAVGAGIAVATFLALLTVYGDPRAFFRVQLSDVPALYRFLWPRSPADVLSMPWAATDAIFAIATSFVLLALVALGEMPPRALGLALMPVCALANVLVQGKGFPYHFHPVTAGVHLQWLALAAWITERARVTRRRLAAVRLVPLAAALALALHVATALEDSPQIRETWLLGSGFTAESRSTRAYFARFPEVDFFPFEMRQAAAYLGEHTRPDDRVQTYGMDPYVLFLARRLSATPYIYAYDLDVDAALAGGTGGVPTDAQAERIRGIGKAHEADLLAQLEAHPPAAFVFLDQSPLTAEYDAWGDFASHCGEAAPWVHAHYRETAHFGHDHVWMRSDLAPEGPVLRGDPATPGALDDEPTSPEDP
jgi:hypothetical protein